MNHLRSAAFVFCGLCATGALQSEVIYLKNGEVIVGAIVGQDRTQMRLRTNKGVRTVPKKSIRRVSYSQAEEQAILNRQREAERREKLKAEAAAKIAAEENERARREDETANPPEDETAEPRPPISPGGLVLRSALLPGLGHLSMGKTFTGAAYMGLSGLALANFVVRRSDALAAENQNGDDVVLNLALTFAPNGLETLQRIGTNFYLNSIAQTPYREAIRRYDQSIQLFVAVYLVQLTHIIYDTLFRESGAAMAPPGFEAQRGWGFRFGPLDPDRVSPSGRRERGATIEYAGRLNYTFVF
jgi:hypothetical protein